MKPESTTIPERIREAARLACEPARSELRKIADEIEERERVSTDQKVKP